MKTAPLLSIGMIFKNEARCMERCLQSLELLRQSIPCELVMADTGSDDGSREIAERYADTVFDYGWNDDFAAARNAVMEQCCGKWYLSIDCDEWLDGDISELLAFFRKRKSPDYAFVIVRNYFSHELERGESYSNFHAMRLARMSTGIRYRGAIHEALPYQEPAARLTRTVFHHDGYLFANPQSAKKKWERNMKLLRRELEKNPDDLRTLNQCIESGSGDAEQLSHIRTAINLVRQKTGHWQVYGGLILSHAVETARQQKLPELDEWTELAHTLCPDSLYVQVDVNHSAFFVAHDAKEWEKAIQYGEAYRTGLKALRADRLSQRAALDMSLGSIRAGDEFSECNLLTGLANAYLQTGQGEKALQFLTELHGERLYGGQVRNAVLALSRVQAQTTLDAAPAMAEFFRQINRPEPNEKRQAERKVAFEAAAHAIFAKKNQASQQELPGYWRPAYTVFSALAGQCEAGRAAYMMMCIDPEEIHQGLLQVEDWQALPVEALEYALQEGVAFPPQERPLNIEILDGLAGRLTNGENLARQMALALPENAEKYPDWQSLYWAQSLVLAALHSFRWKQEKDEKPVSAFARPETSKEKGKAVEENPEIGLALLRRFAQVEALLLPQLYTPQALREENAALLPPMHRWAFYCIRALKALDAGKPQEYLALLRKGITACPGEKAIVQFLLDRFMEDTRPKASPELLALAEKIRAILSAYDPNDPAVTAIRESEAYKQVAWLIEPPPVGQAVQ